MRTIIKNSDDNLETATFAGGCFWCMQPPFENIEGVINTQVGYTGGNTPAPSYILVTGGNTGHLEAVQLIYDPNRIDYMDLLDTFWRNIDPTQKDGQFADIGSQYITAIFYHNEYQRDSAEKSKRNLADSGKFNKPIVTRILPAREFFPAEDEHQHFAVKNPSHYYRYRNGSGRGYFMDATWNEKMGD